jgi:hypothetical protein
MLDSFNNLHQQQKERIDENFFNWLLYQSSEGHNHAQKEKREREIEREDLSLSLSLLLLLKSLYISRKSKYNESLLFVFNGEKFSRLLVCF